MTAFSLCSCLFFNFLMFIHILCVNSDFCLYFIFFLSYSLYGFQEVTLSSVILDIFDKIII